MEIAAFILHYTDGGKATLPIVFGQHLRHEKVEPDPTSQCAHGELAWQEPNPTNLNDQQLRLYMIPFNNPRPRLYKTTLINPRPAAEVERIEYASRVTRSAPFLAGLTVE